VSSGLYAAGLAGRNTGDAAGSGAADELDLPAGETAHAVARSRPDAGLLSTGKRTSARAAAAGRRAATAADGDLLVDDPRLRKHLEKERVRLMNAKKDAALPCPRMCGVSFGPDGQLVFFSNFPVRSSSLLPPSSLPLH
jgi:hypothetical protein